MTDETQIPEADPQSKSGELVAQPRSSLDRPDVNLIEHSPFNSMHAFGVAQRMATMLSSSSIVPNDYRTWVLVNDKWVENPAAVGNCFIAIELANRLRTSPILIMQQVDMIHGRPALRGTLLIGLVNASRQFSPLMFESRGEPGGKDATYGYRAVATNLATGERCEGPWIDWAMVRAENWPAKKGSKWNTMPEQMFRYRAAAFWSRIFAPHITLGLYEAEEVREIEQDTPSRASLLEDKLAEAADPVERWAEDAGLNTPPPPADEAAPEVAAKPRGTRRRVKSETKPDPEKEPAPEATPEPEPEQAPPPDDGTSPGNPDDSLPGPETDAPATTFNLE